MTSSEKDKNTLLVEKLWTRTDAGKAEWQRTQDSDAFLLSFANFSVRVSHVTGRLYALEIIDSTGEVVERITSADYQTISNLYDMARRRALDADGAVDAILRELDKAM